MRWDMPKKPPPPKKGEKKYISHFAWGFKKVENKKILWESYWEEYEYVSPKGVWSFNRYLLKENKPKPRKGKKSSNWMDVE